MPNPDVLTDAEVAVIIDSLATLRFELQERGTEAPNIDSALRKIEAQVTPDTRGIRIAKAAIQKFPQIATFLAGSP